MVCLRNISINTLHKGDDDNGNNNNNNNNNNIFIIHFDMKLFLRRFKYLPE